jgi:hypothetical protein
MLLLEQPLETGELLESRRPAQLVFSRAFPIEGFGATWLPVDKSA